MKKVKTALIIILLILIASSLFYFLPTNGLISQLPFVNRFYTNTTLEVITINGKAKVQIDGQDYGETPIMVDQLSPGDYTIELERISETDNFYKPQTLNVKLTKNTTSRVEVEIAPAGMIHGAILYYTQQNTLEKERGLLSVLSEVEGSKIYLDGEYIKQTPIVAYSTNSKEYQLEVAAQGYETLEIPILVEEGYLLNVKTYLLPIPIIFDTTDNG